MELDSRRILHHNVTAHPTAEWTAHQFPEALPGDHAYRFLIHDRDSIFSKQLGKQVSAMGVRVFERRCARQRRIQYASAFGGTLRRECLDFLIPFNERHLKFVLKAWIGHFNSARPHMSLGPGIPSAVRAPAPNNDHQYGVPTGYAVRSAAVLGGLHHEYRLEKLAA